MSIRNLIDPKCVLNNYQEDLIGVLDHIILSFNKKGLEKFFSKQHASGIYIHGATGCGKTMLLEAFYNSMTLPKKFVHYQELMQETHKILHEQKLHGHIDVYAKQLSQQIKVLCVDEIEIKDIADAMLIGRLFKYLFKYKVFIAVTSNTALQDLYKEGFQRELFLPFIKEMSDYFIVHRLERIIDYRTTKAGDIPRIAVTHDPESKKMFALMTDRLIQAKSLDTKELMFFGRSIIFDRVYDNKILVTSFDYICRANMSSVDYVNICKAFSTIVVENVPQINENETEIAIRFINFIDNAYFNKVTLYMSLDTDIEHIYAKGSRHFEFLRTISRIQEMNSAEWL